MCIKIRAMPQAIITQAFSLVIIILFQILISPTLLVSCSSIYGL